MATESVLQAVWHYQRSIEKNSSDIARLLHCVGKLYKLPITVDHLQETGVGRTVNALRKHNGELGVAAEAVVNKWKEIVASESDRRANDQSSSEDDKEADNPPDENDDAEQEHRSKNTPSTTEHHTHKSEKPTNKHSTEINTTKHSSPSNYERHDRHKSDRREKDRSSHKEKHKKHHESKREEANSSSNKEKKDKNESSKHKRRRDDEKANSDEAVSTEKERKEHKHKSSREDEKKHNDPSRHHHKSSSGKHKSHDNHNADRETDNTKTKSHSSHHSEKKSATADTTPPSTNSASSSKRRHEDNVHNEKTPKKHKSETKRDNKHHAAKDNETAEPGEDGIDSSMGANFADVLGMLNMPQKKAKKSLSTLKASPTSAKKTTAENSSQKTNSVSKLKNERDFDGPSTSSQVNLEKKPNLLAPNVKLAPLDPSIALELPVPVISNNYKPMPLNPTVMDCVFNSSTSSSSRAPPRLLSDAEAYSHGISSKTIRTKVYSGVKSGQLFQVPSLFDLCIRVLQKNIDALEYTGGVPFDVLRPVLERATPQQLSNFEEYNPYLMEDSDLLWQQHVNRTYRTHKREEMESWREMFIRCQEEQERRLNMLAQNIKHSQKVMAEPVRKTQLAFVDSMVKPPRSVMRKQEQYGTKSKLVATPAARVAALSNVTPNAAKTGDVRLRTVAAVKFDPAQAAFAPSRPKKAPLMAKTLQFIRGRQKR